MNIVNGVRGGHAHAFGRILTAGGVVRVGVHNERQIVILLASIELHGELRGDQVTVDERLQVPVGLLQQIRDDVIAFWQRHAPHTVLLRQIVGDAAENQRHLSARVITGVACRRSKACHTRCNAF